MPNVRRPAATRITAWLLPFVAVVAAALVVGSPAGASHAAAATPAGAVFQAVPPTRLADSRQATCGCTRIDANTIRVPVVGRAGVPASTTAVALSLTVTGTTGVG